jgi:hypothetical protein
VRVDPLFQAGDPARVSGGHVTFDPGARTAWHTHPLAFSPTPQPLHTWCAPFSIELIFDIG